jgi:hypothetical protein
MGKYFLDRFEEIMAKNPVSQRWINIGSITHDYLYKNFKWNCHANNGKALIIHEPNLKDCEGDPFPHESEDITDYAISSIISSGIKVDMKPHPNWKNFIGNDGAKLKKPDNVNIVDISVEEIVNYSLIVGSRSTMLLDAVAMGIPTLAIESISGWQDDNYPPVQHGLQGLVPTCPLKDFSKGLADFFNREPNYDIALRNYFLGPLGQVSENYYNFIQFDLKNTY